MAKQNGTADRVQAMLNFIGGDDVLDLLMSGRAKLTIEMVRRLATLTPVTVPGVDINVHDFFKIRKGLWTSSCFNNSLLSSASKKEVIADEATIGYADLAQAANDADIGGELPEGHVFEDVGTFLAHFATRIEGQWGGKSGILLNNGYANIFYVKVNGEVFAASVRWNTNNREWDCTATRLTGRQRHAGHRAFSATAA